jgi:hypothetical protein
MGIFTATFFNWGATETTAMLDHVKDFISDISPLLVVILGVGLAIIIVSAIIGAIKK